MKLSLEYIWKKGVDQGAVGDMDSLTWERTGSLSVWEHCGGLTPLAAKPWAVHSLTAPQRGWNAR